MAQYVSLVFRYLWKKILRRIFDHAVSCQSQILGSGLERVFQDVIEKYYNLRIIRKLKIACKNEFMMQGVQKNNTHANIAKKTAKTRLTIILINCHGNERPLV